LPLCLLLVAACDRQQDGSAPLQPKAAPQGTPKEGSAREIGVRLALLQPSANTDLAALEGSLHAEGRCLYIVGSDKTKNRTLPAFALADVRWDERTQSLRVGNRNFAQDQRVVLGGGEPSNHSALKWLQRPDPSCDSSDLFVVGTIDPGNGGSH
jgi:hypothetical protein